MKKWLKQVYKNNTAIVWAAAVSIIATLVILWQVKDEVTRFTLIMPIFAGFILFSILMTPDEELEGDMAGKVDSKKSTPTKAKTSRP